MLKINSHPSCIYTSGELSEMNKMLFWFWILANGLSSTLMLIAPKFLDTSYARVNALLPWGYGASSLLFLATFGFVIAAVILPGLVIRKINPNVPLWLYALGLLGYASTWVALVLLMNHLRPILGGGVNLYVEGPSWSSLIIRGGGVLTISLTLIWPFLCYSPTMLMSLLREKNWCFPLRLGLAFTAASGVAGITWLVMIFFFFGNYYVPNDFIRFGFDSIHFRDLEIIFIWFFASAFGAAVSFWFLRPTPAPHPQQNP
jgi:hypothetical protein